MFLKNGKEPLYLPNCEVSLISLLSMTIQKLYFAMSKLGSTLYNIYTIQHICEPV